jgi:hypothetical protein
VPKEVRQLIRMLSRENPLYGAPRIHAELLKLGINIGETSVTKYMTFLDNHLKTMAARAASPIRAARRVNPRISDDASVGGQCTHTAIMPRPGHQIQRTST